MFCVIKGMTEKSTGTLGYCCLAKFNLLKKRLNNQKSIFLRASLWTFGSSRYFFVCSLVQPSVKPHQQALDNGVSVLALIVNHFDVVQVGVSPVHHAVDQVQSDTMGEDDLAVHQLSAVLTIHVTALHPRCGPIVCEEHFAVAEGEEQKRKGSFSKVDGREKHFINLT